MARSYQTIAAALALCAVGAASLAQAQTFPSRRVIIYVASSPGGSFDTMGRLFAERLRRKTDQSVVVDNRPGANDTLAMSALLREPADGHTIAVSGNQIADIFLKTLPYDQAGLTPVSILAQTPFAVVASKASNLRNFNEFLAYAKANPGRLTLGAATASHSLEMYQLQFALGFEANVILYKGFAPLETAVLAGEVNASVFGNLGKVKTGQIVAIVTAGDARNPEMPDVPTFKELGVASYEPRASYGVWTRSEVPGDAMNRLVNELQELVRSPEWTARVTQGLGIQPVGSTREFALKYYTAEHQQLKATAERAGIKPQ